MATVPIRMGVSKNDQPIAPAAIKTISGSPPAGGCNVSVACMKAIASPTPSAIESGEDPIRTNKISPIRLEMRCPPITFFGLAKGLCGMANTKTQLAPKEAASRAICAPDISARLRRDCA